MKKRNLLSIFYLIIFLFYIISCTDSPTENNYYTIISADSLSSPNILPQVIFTNPAEGDAGPFGSTDPTEYPGTQKLTIQLNKLVYIQYLNSSAITLKTGDHNIDLDLLNTSSTYDEFLNNILLFSMYEQYLAGKTYTLTIDTTFEDIHGYRLDNPHIISFIPEPKFRVFHVSPAYDDVNPQHFYPNEYGNITIGFNSHVDSSISNHLSVSPHLNGYWQLEYDYNHIDSTTVKFITTDSLSYDTEYTVSVSANANDANGMPINNAYQFSFTTAPFNVRLGSYTGYTGPGGFHVNNNFGFEFNAPIDTSTIQSAFSVSPAISYNIQYQYYNNGYYQGVKIYFYDSEFTADTKYTMTFDTSVRSIHGDYLREPYSYSFKTGM